MKIQRMVDAALRQFTGDQQPLDDGAEEPRDAVVPPTGPRTLQPIIIKIPPKPPPFSMESIPQPLRPRYEAAADAMLDESTTPQQRLMFLSAATTYNVETMEALGDAGVTVKFGPLKNPGVYRARDKAVVIQDQDNPMPREAIIHELAHALDNLKSRKSWAYNLTFARYASEKDPKIEALYRQYLARAAVEEALARGLVHDQASTVAWKTPDRDLQRLPTVKRLLQVAGAAEAVCASVLFDMHHPIIAAGAALLAGATFGIRHALGRLEQHLTKFDSVEAAVPLAQNGVAQVVISGSTTSVQWPAGTKHVLPRTFSLYAVRKRKVAEYFAEGVRMYLASPQKRGLLQLSDPGLHDYIAAMHLDNRPE